METADEYVFETVLQCHFSLQGVPVELKPFPSYRQLLKRSMFKEQRSCRNAHVELHSFLRTFSSQICWKASSKYLLCADASETAALCLGS